MTNPSKTICRAEPTSVDERRTPLVTWALAAWLSTGPLGCGSQRPDGPGATAGDLNPGGDGSSGDGSDGNGASSPLPTNDDRAQPAGSDGEGTSPAGGGSSEAGSMPTTLAPGDAPSGDNDGGESAPDPPDAPDAPADDDAPPNPIIADCSEAVLRTGPPAGQEAFATEPIDDRFPFRSHFMGVFSDDPRFNSMTSTADFDRDGDLDFASGQRHDLGGGMVWWEYCSPDHWVRHAIGTGHESAAGGNAADVDGDGWVDVIAGDSWYRNPQNPRDDSSWDRFDIGAPGAEELIVGDVNADGVPEVFYLWFLIQPQYFSPGDDPTALWVAGPELDNRQQQGGAFGDLDGDGDQDLLAGYRWWHENVNGDGSAWQTHTVFGDVFPDAPLTYVGDLDGDGDLDYAIGEHFGGQFAWAENVNGDGSEFELHRLEAEPGSERDFIHSVVAADFDNDGDLDLFAGQNVGPSWIFENDGAGNFVQHRIAADTRAHEARVGDVDCDGDLDIMGKPWGQQNEGGEQSMPPRVHVYLQNLTVERGGPALFDADRQPYEIFPAAQLRVCP